MSQIERRKILTIKRLDNNDLLELCFIAIYERKDFVCAFGCEECSLTELEIQSV